MQSPVGGVVEFEENWMMNLFIYCISLSFYLSGEKKKKRSSSRELLFIGV
jgi:hypothetical protein